jgi:ABC-type transport system substrate-binding protein
MKRLFLLSFASSLLLLCAAFAAAATRPHYGGTLRIHLREPVLSVDPPKSGEERTPTQLQASSRITRLIFDTLVDLDEHGRAIPALALSWQSDAQQQTWTFTLRRGLTFSDGTPLSSQDVVNCLAGNSPKWKVRTAGPQAINIDTGASTPELLSLLALSSNAVFRSTADGDFLGTGAFTLTTFEPGTRVLLQANDNHWAGRPYLDQVEFIFAGNIRDQLLSRTLQRDHVLEVPFDQAATLSHSGQHAQITPPTDLYAIAFSDNSDVRLREAIALTLDRDSINNVLLQKQGEATGALLPQWITGYAFMMASKPDLERARKLRAEAGVTQPLAFAYEISDPVARSIAERIAVNAQQAGIVLQAYGEKNVSRAFLAKKNNLKLALVRIPLASADPAPALATLTSQDVAGTSEGLLAAEQEALGRFTLVPVAHVPEGVWLSPRVHNWILAPNGDWRVQDMWLEGGQ